MSLSLLKIGLRIAICVFISCACRCQNIFWLDEFNFTLAQSIQLWTLLILKIDNFIYAILHNMSWPSSNRHTIYTLMLPILSAPLIFFNVCDRQFSWYLLSDDMLAYYDEESMETFLGQLFGKLLWRDSCFRRFSYKIICMIKAEIKIGT